MLEADLIIPGHGPPLPVTTALLQTLIAGFQRAEHAARCPDVPPALDRRSRDLAAAGRREGGG